LTERIECALFRFRYNLPAIAIDLFGHMYSYPIPLATAIAIASQTATAIAMTAKSRLNSQIASPFRLERGVKSDLTLAFRVVHLRNVMILAETYPPLRAVKEI
jgi:hypothetical protein